MRALVWAVVLLVVIVGGGLAADAVVRTQVEERVAAQVAEVVPGLMDPEVSIRGFPFLAQVVAGEVSVVRVTAPAATVAQIQLEAVEVLLLEVSTTSPYQARVVEMTALVPHDSIADALALGLELRSHDGLLVASTTVLGLPLEVALQPVARGSTITADLVGLTLAGAAVPVSDLPAPLAEQLTGLGFELTGLPEGVALTGAQVVSRGVQLHAVGTEVALG